MGTISKYLETLSKLFCSLEARKALYETLERFHPLWNFHFVVPPTESTAKAEKKAELAKEEGTGKFHRRNREAEKLPANGELFLEQSLKRLVKTVILI